MVYDDGKVVSEIVLAELTVEELLVSVDKVTGHFKKKGTE